MKYENVIMLKKLEIKHEKGELYSVNVPGFGIKYLNEQGKKILECLEDGEGLNEIVEEMKNGEGLENDVQLKKDLFAFLCDLRSTKIIHFEDVKVLNDLGIVLYEEVGIAGETTYSLVAKNIREFIRKGEAIIMNEQQLGNYRDYSFRMRCFSHKEICYYFEDNDNISDLICVENMEEPNRIVNVALIVFSKKENSVKLMDTIISDAKYWKKRKIRVSILKKKIDDRLMKFLNINNFEQEAVLLEESSDGDLCIYTKWI